MRMIRSRGDKVFDTAIVLVLLFIILITVFPVWYIVVGSFNVGSDYARGGVYFWPRSFTLDNYKIVLQEKVIFAAFGISIARTLISTVGHLLVTSLFAYAFSRKGLAGKKIYSTICLITMFFSGGLIPYYLVLNALGLIDSFWVYVLPSLFSFYNVLIFSGFFRELPEALMESARIEGAGEYRIFFQLVIPLSKPVFSALALFVAVGQWNAYFDSMMFTNSTHLQTIMLYLMKMVRNSEASSTIAKQYAAMSAQYRQITGMSIQLAAMVCATLPIVLVYPFLQKYFSSGILIGSIKE